MSAVWEIAYLENNIDSDYVFCIVKCMLLCCCEMHYDIDQFQLVEIMNINDVEKMFEP